MSQVIEVNYDRHNWWGDPIYRTKDGVPIVKLEEGFFSLSDNDDIDSDPNKKLKDEYIKIIKDYA